MENLWPNNFQLWKPHVSQNHVQLPHHAINLSSICHQYHLFYVTMRSSPCFFWTAQLSGLRDTASWCGFPVHAAPWCPLFPHVPHGFSLDFSSMICTCSAVPSGWKTFSPKSDSPANPPIRTEEFGSIAWHICFYNILSSSFIIIHPSFIIFHQHQNMFLPEPNRVSCVLEMQPSANYWDASASLAAVPGQG